MHIWRCVVATILLCAVLARGTLAGAPFCVCGRGGTLIANTPRCVCNCTGEYVQPDCRYRSFDIIHVDTWIAQNFTAIVTESLQTRLVNGLIAEGLPANVASEITFVAMTRSKTVENVTSVRFAMFGVCALYLKAAYEKQRPWIKMLLINAIVDATVLPPAVYPPMLSLVRSVVIYQNPNGIAVTVDDIGWVLGVIGTLFVVFNLERCCYRNTEKHLIEEQVPPLHDHKGMSYER